MTHNQIAYQANLINEAKNLQQAQADRWKHEVDTWLASIEEENVRARNLIAKQQADEQARHNLASERLQGFANALASNQLLLDQRRQAEAERHNLSTEAETARSNMRNEEITSTRDENRNRVDQWNAGVNAFNAASGFVGHVLKAFSPMSLFQ